MTELLLIYTWMGLALWAYQTIKKTKKLSLEATVFFVVTWPVYIWRIIKSRQD